ncbi:MAG: hypothetical protein GF329_15450 [Candidatus Lokiarchaeota archaeon]|nr:hypothetical protein [Candidatus Lokiarchaeota archaeon]
MVSKKFSFLKKIFIRIGKHIGWKKAKKFNTYTAAKWCQACLEEIIKLNDDNVVEGVEEFEGMVKSGAAELVGRIFLEPIVFGIKPTILFSKNLSDIGFTAKQALFFGEGPYSKKMFKSVKFFSADESDDKIAKLVFTIKKCMFCCEPEKFDKYPLKDMEDKTFGNFFCKLFEAMFQYIIEYSGISNYKTESKETKCLLHGDEFGEWTIWFKKI